MKKILIVGAGGQIGSELTSYLRKIYGDANVVATDMRDCRFLGEARSEEHGEYVTIVSRPDAIRYAIEHAMEGDVIVLAGKGHEDYQEINGQKFHMDERELVADVVKDGNFIR